MDAMQTPLPAMTPVPAGAADANSIPGECAAWAAADEVDALRRMVCSVSSMNAISSYLEVGTA